MLQVLATLFSSDRVGAIIDQNGGEPDDRVQERIERVRLLRPERRGLLRPGFLHLRQELTLPVAGTRDLGASLLHLLVLRMDLGG